MITGGLHGTTKARCLDVSLNKSSLNNSKIIRIYRIRLRLVSQIVPDRIRWNGEQRQPAKLNLDQLRDSAQFRFRRSRFAKHDRQNFFSGSSLCQRQPAEKSIRGTISVSCLQQFCDGWAFAESVICHFSSNHQWGINHYSLLVAKKIQDIAHFSILYRGWRHQIM